jgi:hypothetical protein
MFNRNPESRSCHANPIVSLRLDQKVFVRGVEFKEPAVRASGWMKSGLRWFGPKGQAKCQNGFRLV